MGVRTQPNNVGDVNNGRALIKNTAFVYVVADRAFNWNPGGEADTMEWIRFREVSGNQVLIRIVRRHATDKSDASVTTYLSIVPSQAYVIHR